MRIGPSGARSVGFSLQAHHRLRALAQAELSWTDPCAPHRGRCGRRKRVASEYKPRRQHRRAPPTARQPCPTGDGCCNWQATRPRRIGTIALCKVQCPINASATRATVEPATRHFASMAARSSPDF
jgi:hypothetical protein